ncbi:hypothetical protein MP228_001755 [Amoeboaphelidium protococcarum]|nr:hypothetical protein MP228_001755 [Amoeboaphelidium protococcarum]
MSNGYLVTGAVIALTAALFKILHKQKTKTPKNVLIVGASRGIGASLAKVYGHKLFQCNLLLIARNVENLKQLVDQITSDRLDFNGAGFVEYVAADISSNDGIARIVDSVRSTFNSNLDEVVWNAAVTSCLSVDELSARSDNGHIVQQMYQTNVIAPINFVTQAYDIITKSASNIVVVSSAAAYVSPPTRSLYASTKHALNGFFDSLRIELAHYGVNVSIACPGRIETDFRKYSLEATDTATASYSGSTKVSSLFSMSADDCAIKMYAGIRSRHREIWVPQFSWLLKLLNVIMPSLVDRIVIKNYNFRRDV